MYRVAICDDEPLAGEENKKILCRILEDRKLRIGMDCSVDVFTDSKELLNQLKKRHDAYHLLLLDIKLNEENGIAFASYLREKRVYCSIIYITAYRDFVFDCFATRPLEYLLKPVQEEKLAAAVRYDYEENYRPEFLFLKKSIAQKPIPMSTIYYLEATQHKVAIQLEEKRIYINESLSSMESKVLVKHFCRCHASFIANLEHIQSISRSAIVLTDGKEIPISRRYYDEVMRRHITYLKE